MIHCLTDNDVKSELSFTYVKAVASMAKMSCDVTSRTNDANGIDAVIYARGDILPQKSLRNEILINVQIKSTSKIKIDFSRNEIAFFINSQKQYNTLVEERRMNPTILVVYCLPNNMQYWIQQSEQELVLHGGAYWTCLMGKEKTTNSSGETVYIPRNQLFTVKSLTDFACKIANLNFPNYKSIMT